MTRPKQRRVSEMDNRQINWIIGFSAVLGVIATCATIPMMRLWFTLSVALGAALGIGNLLLIRRMVRRMINATVSGGRTASNFFLKFGVLAAAIGLTFKFLPIEPLGFLLGFGALVIAVVLGSLFGPDPHEPHEDQQSTASSE
ncbi:MAG: hypothetical protein ACI9U2_004522 [Bradymonadia bacterium]|jgi:hypothetical protein